MTNTPAPRRALAEQDTPVPCEDKASVTPSKRPASSFGKERTYSPHKKAATAAPDEKEAAGASVTTLDNGRDVISRLDDIRAANNWFHREFEEAMRTANGTNTRLVGRPPHTG
ncbi:hypothetical protein K504DRAFT_539595 [Pleomassaria siparia CBS 279.74]|uniref:Uncharacterized protein n=1 Tax=Pleomassaria siparia CBS 279.74 TaxID=1314801 RepID=A0A6G1JQI0_9PLEO|nr:hypothetical protein K504DRAFT_539595 [Pleomassaria siparia CBS 279.74]